MKAQPALQPHLPNYSYVGKFHLPKRHLTGFCIVMVALCNEKYINGNSPALKSFQPFYHHIPCSHVSEVCRDKSS